MELKGERGTVTLRVAITQTFGLTAAARTGLAEGSSAWMLQSIVVIGVAQHGLFILAHESAQIPAVHYRRAKGAVGRIDRHDRRRVDVHLLRHEPAAPTSDTAERLDTTIPDGSRRSGLQRSKPTLLPGTSYAEYIPHGIEAWAFVSCPRCRSKCADSENCSIFRNVTQLDSLVRTGEHYFVVTHNSAPTQTCEFDLSQLPRRRPARQGTDYVLPNQGSPLCRRRS